MVGSVAGVWDGQRLPLIPALRKKGLVPVALSLPGAGQPRRETSRARECVEHPPTRSHLPWTIAARNQRFTPGLRRGRPPRLLEWPFPDDPDDDTLHELPK